MLRSLATVSGFTLMSRILGFLRDILMARYLGTTVQMDAFVAAFRFPNLFRRIFGEGAFNAAFVPLFGRKLQEEGHEEAKEFGSNAFSWLTYILIIGTVVLIPLMRWVMAVVAFGFLTPENWSFSWEWFWEMVRYPQGTEHFELAVALGRIMFCYLLCMALAAQLSGVLNTLKVFSVPAFVPVLMNVIWLTGVGVVVPLLGFQQDLVGCATVASWCVFIAGWAQLLTLYFTCRKKGMPMRLKRPQMSPEIKRLGLLMIPGILAAGIQQVNLLIGTQIASLEKAAVSNLYYSDRVFQLPLGMIGIAFGVVLLPEITRLLRGNQVEDAKESLRKGMTFSMLITLPAMVAMLVIPQELIASIFQWGDRWDGKSTDAVAAALAAFAIGLPAYVLIKVLQPAYFARENTKTPMKIAAATVAVNIIGSLILFPIYKHVGIALATTIAGWVNLLLLWYLARDFIVIDSNVAKKLSLTLFASIGMGVALFFAKMPLSELLKSGPIGRVSGTAILILLGFIVYAGLAVFLKATTLHELKTNFKR